VYSPDELAPAAKAAGSISAVPVGLEAWSSAARDGLATAPGRLTADAELQASIDCPAMHLDVAHDCPGLEPVALVPGYFPARSDERQREDSLVSRDVVRALLAVCHDHYRGSPVVERMIPDEVRDCCFPLRAVQLHDYRCQVRPDEHCCPLPYDYCLWLPEDCCSAGLQDVQRSLGRFRLRASLHELRAAMVALRFVAPLAQSLLEAVPDGSYPGPARDD
jgi:hypothetical protein